jgi:hypothetical protein
MNDIPLDLSCLQKVQKVITCTIEGILEPADLTVLLEKPQAPAGASAGDLKRVREKHHSVARMVAAGMSQRLIAGYSEPHLSTLLNNPSMQELVAYYRAQHTNAAEVIAERLRAVGLEAVEKLVKDIDNLDANELLGLAKLGLDRSGHGPQSKHHVVTENHLLDHAELQRLNRLARRESAEDIIDLKALPAPSEDVDSSGAGDNS